MTRKGDIWYDNRATLCRAGYVNTWDGLVRYTLDSATRHRDGRGWTLRWTDSSGARIVGVNRGDNDIVRVRGVTVAPAPDRTVNEDGEVQ